MTKPESRVSRGKQKPQVSFPVGASNIRMPEDYQETLRQLKQRIGTERLKAVLSANAAMTLLYWEHRSNYFAASRPTRLGRQSH